MYYYWNQSGQQQYPTGQFPSGQSTTTGQMQQGQVPPSFSGGVLPGGPIPMMRNATAPTLREESYIENILRLNRGKVGTFYFTVPAAESTEQRGNTKIVRGVVVEAGRDHTIIREVPSNHYFLFPMIYFDFAEFDEQLTYFAQTPGIPT